MQSAASALLLILCASTALALPGLNPLWSLPLGLGLGTDTDVLPFATDGEVIYTANTRGVLFAVDATTSELLWSSPGNDDVSEILLFPEVPDKVYVVSYGYFQEVSVQAMRRGDGAVLGTLNNLTGSATVTAHIAVSGQNLAVWHNYGVMVTDQVLNPIWRRDASPNLTFYYSHVGANADLVASIYHEGVFAVMTNAVSFDARTGAVVCNISNITDLMNEDGGIPLTLTPSNLSVAALMVSAGPDEAYMYWRLMDFGKCKVIRTYGINDAAMGYPAEPFLLNPGQSNELFVKSNLSNATWLLTASPVTEQITTSFQWSQSFVNVGHKSAVFSYPMIGRLPFQPEAIVVWVNAELVALNASSGVQLWSFPHEIPVAAPSQGEFIYPLGAGRLLVPNLEGYIVANIHSGAVETVVEDNPVFASGALASFMNTTSQTPFVVYVAEDGSLVAAH